MIVSVEEVKEYLKIDGDEENKYLEILINAAEEFIMNGTGKKFDSNNKLAKIVALFIIGDMHENRTMTTEKVGVKVREIVTMILIQLAY
ncbi:head-tail connector protein [Clostridium ihumii]|uniref:head-tail connector protein n=1 Tax=Clostridium ihumii TaxID=1470356 RepID=UPI003D347185